MLNLKLFNLLDSLSEKELKEFRKLIVSPFYSKSRNYLPLLDYIIRLQRKGKRKLSPEEIFNRINSKNKLKQQTFNNRFSELYKLGEEYLVYQSLTQDNQSKEILLLNQLYRKKMYTVFENSLKRLNNSLENLQYGDTSLIKKIMLNRLDMKNLGRKKLSENAFKKYYEHSEFVTSYFLINLFLFGIELIQQEDSNRKYEFNLSLEVLNNLNFKSIIGKLRKSDSRLSKIVCMQYYFYRIFRNPDDESGYFEGKKIFGEICGSLSESYRKELYKLMTFYCMIRQNQGIKKFEPELFELYTDQLKLGLYKDSETDQFPVNAFRNYVLIGILLKKVKWTENFIQKYSSELPENNREDEVNLSYSKLFFSNKNYEKSLNYLSGFKGLNFIHYTDSSMLKLCIYYELELYECAFLEVDRLKHYLKNHTKVMKNLMEHVTNFLAIYQKLLRVKTGAEGKDTGMLMRQFKKIKFISKKDWLLEKLTDISF